MPTLDTRQDLCDIDAADAHLPVLVVAHQERTHPGHIGHWLTDRGLPLDIRRPCLGDPLPDTLARHSGAIIFGGPMSANDDALFLRRELAWIAVPLEEDKPLIGVCLGAQMIAKHLGARVAPRGDGLTEIGYCPIAATEHGAPLGPWPSHVYQWHGEGFEMPAGAVRLASSDRFPNQAFAYGRAVFGLQFHAEITRQMVHRWTTRSAARLSAPGAEPDVARHVMGHTRHAGAQRAWLDAFLTRWTGLMRQGASPLPA